MRIVGGRFRGGLLSAPKSQAIRPTADRCREALFNMLTHSYGNPTPDARVLDLFAGTGALGLESLSRGAAFALFVDDGAQARGIIRENVEALGAGGATRPETWAPLGAGGPPRLFRRDATRMGEAAPNAPFSVVFCDPPYGK